MKPTPCDVHLYDSDEYNDCIKDIVYEAAQDEWIMLDPRFPNLKGITPKRIDEFLANAEDTPFGQAEFVKDYFEDYLQHVMVYDRDDIVSMCYDLGKQIEEKYPGKLHSDHSIFVTTPRGGYEVLSIFAYTNDLKKEQIPSHFKSISEDEYDASKTNITFDIEEGNDIDEIDKEIIIHYESNNYPIMPNMWLDPKLPMGVFDIDYENYKIETIFIIDDVIASGEQMLQALSNVSEFFNYKVKVIPVVLVDRKDDDIDAIFDIETIGINQWDIARPRILTPEKLVRKLSIEEHKQNKKIYDSLITVRFPWGSPDGESDKILTTLYESRRGLERIERKQRRCAIDPDKCELK